MTLADSRPELIQVYDGEGWRDATSDDVTQVEGL